jgi:hypothetical protein
MLILCGVIAVAGPIPDLYNRLEITDQAVMFRSVLRRWSVPLSDIKDWKIKGGNGSSLSLHVFTQDHRECCVPGLSSLGVRDPNQVANVIAKCLRNHRRGK